MSRSHLRSVSLLLCLLLSACAYEYTEPGRSGMSQVTPSGPTAIIESREYVYYALPGIEISEQADGSVRYHYNRDDGGQLAVLRANVEEDYSSFGDPLKHELHADPYFSVYYSAEEHQQMQYDYRYMVEVVFEYQQEFWPHHSAVTYNDDLSEIRLTMKREDSSEPDIWSPWDRYGSCANHYQVYNGTDPEEVQFVIVFIDDASGEVFQRIDNLATMLGP